MSKKDDTYNIIIDKSLYLFNTKGIHQTSIQDIMDITSLPKGAIYRRFKNKNDIALAAYEKAGTIIWAYMQNAIKGKSTATEKIIALSEIYLDAVHNPPIEGGCPLLNTAVESDSTFPELKQIMSIAFQEMSQFVSGIISEGKDSGEFSQETDPNSLASYILSSMEGAIMTSRLTLNNEHIYSNITYVKVLLNGFTNQSIKL
ncbi:TetR/AcrR family transcriptional regulator [Shouchella miscanthi]|uniref:TetR/AcrR family transcriptional regulator n=1 Tax=Shouchella miscanthi TaxID=2598861 RepID=A0ABU6NTA2_9BACI|nr:TetR/AcrR family transcriptional regulator [Shouchella miscanthi]MED4130022.1 TetR/AcrR family transcriptional regulator [Shouchella miscanthi]